MSSDKVVESGSNGDARWQDSVTPVHEEPASVVRDDETGDVVSDKSTTIPVDPTMLPGGVCDSSNVEDVLDDDEQGKLVDAETDSHDIGWSDNVELTDLIVRPQAIPYRIAAVLLKEKLDPLLDSYFKAHKKLFKNQVAVVVMNPGRPDRIRQEAKKLLKWNWGRMNRDVVERLLGMSTMYMDLLTDAVSKRIAVEYPGYEVMMYQDVEVAEIDENYMITAHAFFVPDVTLPSGMDPKNLGVEIVVRTPDEVEKLVDTKITYLSRMGMLTTPKDGICDVGDAVVVNVTAVKDGAVIHELSVKGHTIFTDPEVVWESPIKPYASEFVGLKAGDKAKKAVNWGESAIVMHVEAVEVFYARRATIEEVVKSRGQDSVEEWRTSLVEKQTKTLADREKQEIDTKIERGILSAADVGAVPISWLTRKAEEGFIRIVSSVNGDENKAIKELGARDRKHALGIVGAHIHKELCTKLAIRAYGKFAGVGDPGPFNNTDAYVREVMEWAKLNVRVERLTTADIEERRRRAQSESMEKTDVT